MKRVLLHFSMLLAIGLLSACSNTDDDPDVPEEWSKGPKGFFELKIVNEIISDTELVELMAAIESAPDKLSSNEKMLLGKGRVIQFHPSDIPVSDRKINYTFRAQIVSYYQIPDPYEHIRVFCQIKKSK